MRRVKKRQTLCGHLRERDGGEERRGWGGNLSETAGYIDKSDPDPNGLC
jgi:hypothetical protein